MYINNYHFYLPRTNIMDIIVRFFFCVFDKIYEVNALLYFEVFTKT